MELEVNDNHKKFELGNLRNPLRRFSIGALGTVIGVSLYGGCLVNEVHASDVVSSSISDFNIDSLPDSVRRDVLFLLGKESYEMITSSDLERIKSFNIRVYNDSDTDLSYLKYFPNLEELYIESFISDSTYFDGLKNVAGLKNLSLFLCNDYGAITKDSLSFLDNVHIDSISLIGYSLYPGVEEYLEKIDDIKLGYGDYDIDFGKLTSVKNLDFYRDGPYDVAIYLDSEKYNKLVSNGVNITFNSEDDKDTFIEVNERLDGIVSSLGIDDNSTNQEKFDSILIYVLEHLQYDEKISEMIRTLGIENVVGAEEFYDGGLLYGALEKDSAICGNYAALVEALLNRVGYQADSSIISNSRHAWNAVKVDGEVYFVDATWLDNQVINESVQDEVLENNGEMIITFRNEPRDAVDVIRCGEGHKLRWYFEECDGIDMDSLDPSGSHSNYVVPEYMFSDYDDEEFEKDESVLNYQTMDEEIPEIGDSTTKIKIGNKVFLIGAGTLVGILSSLGCAFGVHSIREKESQRNRMENGYSVYEDFNNYGRRF